MPLKPQNVYSRSPLKTDYNQYSSPSRWKDHGSRYSPTYFRKKYNKYDNKESILLQILRPEQPQIPEKINEQLNNSTLREFQDFLSSQIYKHIILNNNKYKTESKNHYTSIDVSNYRLSSDQKANQDLKKSICVMMSHYMEFIVSIMDYLKSMIDSEFNSMKQSK